MIADRGCKCVISCGIACSGDALCDLTGKSVLGKLCGFSVIYSGKISGQVIVGRTCKVRVVIERTAVMYKNSIIFLCKNDVCRACAADIADAGDIIPVLIYCHQTGYAVVGDTVGQLVYDISLCCPVMGIGADIVVDHDSDRALILDGGADRLSGQLAEVCRFGSLCRQCCKERCGCKHCGHHCRCNSSEHGVFPFVISVSYLSLLNLLVCFCRICYLQESAVNRILLLNRNAASDCGYNNLLYRLMLRNSTVFSGGPCAQRRIMACIAKKSLLPFLMNICGV